MSKELAELIAEEEKYAREIRGINAELSLMEGKSSIMSTPNQKTLHSCRA